MVAINHYGYVAGLLAAPPERAIKVATDKAGKEVVCAEGRGTFMKIGPLRSFDIL